MNNINDITMAIKDITIGSKISFNWEEDLIECELFKNKCNKIMVTKG